MDRKKALGLVFVVALATVTYAVTSATISMARQARGPRGEENPRRPRITVVDTIVDEQAVPDLGISQPGEIVIPISQVPHARGEVLITSVEPVPDGVEVSAVGKLVNNIEDRPFVWTLSARRRGEAAPVWKRRYDHQIGLSRKGTNLEPTFRERVQLPPGDYVFAVSIHEVPERGLRSLDDAEFAKGYCLGLDSERYSVR